MTFVAEELEGDQAAGDFALKIAKRHSTCAYVAVYEGDRLVCTRERAHDEILAALRPQVR